MKLFSRKKSNPQVADAPPISRPRAQGHLPPTTGPRPPSAHRRSSTGPPSESVTTPLYARFARAESIENLNLNLRGSADSRTPSYAPSAAELENDAQRLGYDRPWARERQGSLDAPKVQPEPPKSAPAFDMSTPLFDTATPVPLPDRARSPLAPGTGPTLRMVQNPPPGASMPDRKSTASRRLSMDAVIAADPFMASKMQSVLRRAPSNALPNDTPAPPAKTTPPPKAQPPIPVPSRSSTAPLPPVASNSRPAPAARVPSAPPVPAVPSRSVSTSTSRAPPVSQSYRPSFDATSDDEHSTFSHSQSGHQTQIRSVYPSAQSNPNAKRERGPPPVAGTPSAYAWRSGQSDDGHGGSNFYTGGSQMQSQLGAGLPPLPPGAQPPQPGGQQPRKRAPSNPPVSRVPYPATNGVNGGTRRVSVDDAARGIEGRVSGGPGTWGGVAPGPPPPSVPGPTPPSIPGPTPPYGPTTNPPPSHGSIPNGAARLVSPSASIQIPGPGFDPYQSQSQSQSQQRSYQSRVPSVEPGQIFQHPQVNPQPQAQVNNPLVPNGQTPVRHISVSSSAPAPVQNSSPPQGQTATRHIPVGLPAPTPLQNGARNGPTVGTGTDQGRVLSAVAKVGPPQPTSSPIQNQGGRQSPAKEGRQSPAKEQRQSPIKTSADRGRESPFKANVNVNGRQSPFKPDMAGTGRQSPPKPEGRQSPPKSSPFSTPQRSTLSVDTTAGSTRTPSTLTPGSGVSASRTPVSANASIAANAPSTSNTLSPPGSASPARATLSTSPARTTLSASPAQATFSPAAPSPSPARALPPTSPARTRVSSGPFRPPNRAPSSSESAASYGTAMPLESEYAFDTGAAPGPSRLALGGGGTGLAPLNTNMNTPSTSGLPTTPRDRLPVSKAASETSTPTSAMMTARMTPTTPSLATMSPPAVSARASSPITIPSESGAPELSDSESMHSKKRNLLVKTRRLDGASSFRSSEERIEHEAEKDVEKARMSAGLEMAEDPFARAPPTVVKSVKKTKMPLTPDATPDPNANESGDTTPRRGMPLSPPLSSDDHEQNHPGAGLGLGVQKNPETMLMSPALTDNGTEVPPVDEIADMSDAEEMEPESTTPPGSPPLPKVYPLALHLATPPLLAALLHELSFRDWNALNALNANIRRQLEETRVLREEVLEFWLRGIGYARWTSPRRETLVLSLRDLNAYMRGVSIAVYRYSAIAESFLAVRSQQEQTSERVPGAASKGNLVRALASSCRAYTKVMLRLREQVEAMGGGADGEFRSPLLRVGHAPLLRVFVPSKEGAWLSDTSVLDCEKELKRAGALGLLRVGDVVWDAAVGDEGNAGRMVWDGNYLVDLDYTYSTTGELPKYIHSFAFSPSYWHKVIRTSNSPLCHIDLAPYALEIAQNLQLVQDRVQTETPQGGRHTVVRWVHRSRFHPRPGTPIPNSNPPAVVDRMWDGVVIVEVEGTNEGLADLQARCGYEVRLFPAKTAGMNMDKTGKGLGRTPFRLLRALSRPGEIWMRAVREKERLL
ncbi:hypothetical protein FS749_016554 [Ceratobasidium sp. UAMH 11750]|nr:hypothetical protein FS749_016554 [Ceratobasidium sp. UAMH 11750]